MIRNSIIFSIVASALYIAYVNYGGVEPVGQHQWQRNIIRTQDYIYTDSLHNRDLILGTSLSDKLHPDSLPNNIYMLTYPGLSIWDGFEVIDKTGVKPKLVFIEQNAMLKPEESDFDDYVFGTANYYSKGWIPALQDKYQPGGQIGKYLALHSPKRFAFFGNYILNPILRLFQGDKPITIDRKAYIEHAIALRNKPDTALTVSTVKRLKAKIDALEKEGITVYIYETPIDSSVFFGAHRLTIVNTLHKYMSQSKYHYLHVLPEDVKKYQTGVDRVHLNDTSASKFARVFSGHILKARQNLKH